MSLTRNTNNQIILEQGWLPSRFFVRYRATLVDVNNLSAIRRGTGCELNHIQIEIRNIREIINGDEITISDIKIKVTLNAINMFKERILKYEKIDKEYRQTEKNEECIICYISNKTIELKCNHRLCRDCTSRIDKCPFCRREIIFE